MLGSADENKGGNFSMLGSADETKGDLFSMLGSRCAADSSYGLR